MQLPFGERVGKHLIEYAVCVDDVSGALWMVYPDDDDGGDAPAKTGVDLAVVAMACETTFAQSSAGPLIGRGVAYEEALLYWYCLRLPATGKRLRHCSPAGLQLKRTSDQTQATTDTLVLVTSYGGLDAWARHLLVDQCLELLTAGREADCRLLLAAATRLVGPAGPCALQLAGPDGPLPLPPVTVVPDNAIWNETTCQRILMGKIGVHACLRLAAACISATTVVFSFGPSAAASDDRRAAEVRGLAADLFDLVRGLAFPFPLICPFFFLPASLDVLRYHDAFVAAVAGPDADPVRLGKQLPHALVLSVSLDQAMGEHSSTNADGGAGGGNTSSRQVSVVSEPKSFANLAFDAMLAMLAPAAVPLKSHLSDARQQFKGNPSGGGALASMALDQQDCLQLMAGLQATVAPFTTSVFAGLDKCVVGGGAIVDVAQFVDSQRSSQQRTAWAQLQRANPCVLFIRADHRPFTRFADHLLAAAVPSPADDDSDSSQQPVAVGLHGLKGRWFKEICQLASPLTTAVIDLTKPIHTQLDIQRHSSAYSYSSSGTGASNANLLLAAMLSQLHYEQRSPALLGDLLALQQMLSKQHVFDGAPGGVDVRCHGIRSLFCSLWAKFATGISSVSLNRFACTLIRQDPATASALDHKSRGQQQNNLAYCVVRDIFRSKSSHASPNEAVGCFLGGGSLRRRNYSAEQQCLLSLYEMIMNMPDKKVPSGLLDDLSQVYEKWCLRKRLELDLCCGAAVCMVRGGNDGTRDPVTNVGLPLMCLGLGQAAEQFVGDVLFHLTPDSTLGSSAEAGNRVSVSTPSTQALWRAAGDRFLARTRAAMRKHTGLVPGGILLQEPGQALSARIDRVIHCRLSPAADGGAAAAAAAAAAGGSSAAATPVTTETIVTSCLQAAARIRAYSVAFDLHPTGESLELVTAVGSWLARQHSGATPSSCSVTSVAFFLSSSVPRSFVDQVWKQMQCRRRMAPVQVAIGQHTEGPLAASQMHCLLQTRFTPLLPESLRRTRPIALMGGGSFVNGSLETQPEDGRAGQRSISSSTPSARSLSRSPPRWPGGRKSAEHHHQAPSPANALDRQLVPFPLNAAHSNIRRTIAGLLLAPGAPVRRSAAALVRPSSFGQTLYYWRLYKDLPLKGLPPTVALTSFRGRDRARHHGLAALAGLALVSSSPHAGLMPLVAAQLRHEPDGSLGQVDIVTRLGWPTGDASVMSLGDQRALGRFRAAAWCPLYAACSLADALDHLHSAVGLASGGLSPSTLLVYGSPTSGRNARLVLRSPGVRHSTGAQSALHAFYRAPEHGAHSVGHHAATDGGGDDSGGGGGVGAVSRGPPLEISSEASRRADVWSFGWVVWSLLAGQTVRSAMQQNAPPAGTAAAAAFQSFRHAFDWYCGHSTSGSSSSSSSSSSSPSQVKSSTVNDALEVMFQPVLHAASVHGEWLARSIWRHCAALDPSSRLDFCTTAKLGWRRLKSLGWNGQLAALPFGKRFGADWLKNADWSTVPPAPTRSRRPHLLVYLGGDVATTSLAVDCVVHIAAVESFLAPEDTAWGRDDLKKSNNRKRGASPVTTSSKTDPRSSSATNLFPGLRRRSASKSSGTSRHVRPSSFSFSFKSPGSSSSSSSSEVAVAAGGSHSGSEGDSGGHRASDSDIQLSGYDGSFIGQFGGHSLAQAAGLGLFEELQTRLAGMQSCPSPKTALFTSSYQLPCRFVLTCFPRTCDGDAGDDDFKRVREIVQQALRLAFQHPDVSELAFEIGALGTVNQRAAFEAIRDYFDEGADAAQNHHLDFVVLTTALQTVSTNEVTNIVNRFCPEAIIIK